MADGLAPYALVTAEVLDRQGAILAGAFYVRWIGSADEFRNRLFDDHRLVANAGLLLRSPWPTAWDCASWWTTMLTWEMRRVEPMLETNC